MCGVFFDSDVPDEASSSRENAIIAEGKITRRTSIGIYEKRQLISDYWEVKLYVFCIKKP